MVNVGTTGGAMVATPDFGGETYDDSEIWAAGLSVPLYALDDETAVKVVDGDVEVVSEGNWKLFTP